MPNDTALDDDYVAELLRRDAQRSQHGLLTSGPRSSAAKPNTRFLNNIIRSTDRHNAALKAKEEHDSRARLRDLDRTSDTVGQRHQRDEDLERPSKRSRTGERPGRWANALGGLGRSTESSKRRTGDKHSKREDGRESDRAATRRRRHSEDDAVVEKHLASKRHAKDQDKAREARRRSRSPKHDQAHQARQHRKKDRSRSRSPKSRERRRRRTPSFASGADSDPLEDMIGPLPPARGRTSRSDQKHGIDAHFHPSYDPKADVHLDDDDERDDWDMALESLRDRAKWRSKGTERLKAAGFTDEEIERSRGDRQENDEALHDFKWKKRGEEKEWDRGKVSDGERIDVKAAWASK